jgi:hypothetical protein
MASLSFFNRVHRALWRYPPGRWLAHGALFALVWLNRLILRGYPLSKHGIRTAAHSSNQHLSERLEAALDLIAKYDPQRLQQLRTQMSAIVVQNVPGTLLIRFLGYSRLLQLDPEYVESASAETLAQDLVRESELAPHNSFDPLSRTNPGIDAIEAAAQAAIQFASRLPPPSPDAPTSPESPNPT